MFKHIIPKNKKTHFLLRGFALEFLTNLNKYRDRIDKASLEITRDRMRGNDSWAALHKSLLALKAEVSAIPHHRRFGTVEEIFSSGSGWDEHKLVEFRVEAHTLKNKIDATNLGVERRLFSYGQHLNRARSEPASEETLERRSIGIPRECGRILSERADEILHAVDVLLKHNLNKKQ